MDLYCQRCGEPWDFWSAKAEKDGGDMSEEEAQRFKAGIDCPACHGKEECTLKLQCKDCEDSAENSAGIFTCMKMRFKRPFRATLASALTDILGDDIDGIAAEMEDAEWMLGVDFWQCSLSS